MPTASKIQKFSLASLRRAADFPGRLTWLAVMAVGVVDTIWLTSSERLSLNLESLFSLAFSFTALAVLTLCSCQHGSARVQKMHAPMTGILFIILGFAVLRVFNHLTMSIPFALADDELARFDAALGFDWLVYADWVSHRPVIIAVFQFAYTGLTLVALIVFVLLLVAARQDRAKEFARLIFWTGLAATAIGAFFPAKAAMAHFASSDLMKAFGPDAGVYHLPYLSALRSNAAHVLDLRELPGLVVIPSFHTACGLLIAYCCRGIRWLFPAAILYSVTMIASTPIMGGHYFVDLIAGACLTVSMVAVDRWMSMSGKTETISANSPVAA